MNITERPLPPLARRVRRLGHLNVAVNDRGLIDLADRNIGFDILKFEGTA